VKVASTHVYLETVTKVHAAHSNPYAAEDRTHSDPPTFCNTNFLQSYCYFRVYAVSERGRWGRCCSKLKVHGLPAKASWHRM